MPFVSATRYLVLKIGITVNVMFIIERYWDEYKLLLMMMEMFDII